MTDLVQNITFIDKVKLGILYVKNIFQQYLKTKQSMNIFIFPSLKNVNILLWNDILETQNFFLLDKDYNENKKYSKSEQELLSKTLETFYDDYFLRLNNKYAKANLTETKEKISLSAKILILQECIKSMLFIRDNYAIIKNAFEKELEIQEVVKIISKGVKFKAFADIDENITTINKILISNQTTFERKYPKEEVKETIVNYTFEKQLVDVEQCLMRSIDVEKTNVYKWIELINLAQEISKKRLDNGK